MSAGVARFTLSERALHWALALGYLLLLASGLPLMMPALQRGIRGYSPLIGERLHIACAIFWVLAMLAAVALGDRRRLGRTLEELARLEPSDRRWLRSFPKTPEPQSSSRHDPSASTRYPLHAPPASCHAGDLPRTVIRKSFALSRGRL